MYISPYDHLPGHIKVSMQDKQHHQKEVEAFLQKHFRSTRRSFTFPEGSGNETYFAHGNERSYFVKLGVQISRHQAVASLGLTPQVLADGYLTDGTSMIIQNLFGNRSRKP